MKIIISVSANQRRHQPACHRNGVMAAKMDQQIKYRGINIIESSSNNSVININGISVMAK
jgi:hypothetical protein